MDVKGMNKEQGFIILLFKKLNELLKLEKNCLSKQKSIFNIIKLPVFSPYFKVNIDSSY